MALGSPDPASCARATPRAAGRRVGQVSQPALAHGGRLGILPSMDVIRIVDLEVHYHVGVPDEERARAQRLLLGVAMEHDFREAAQTDDLRYTINYFAVSQRLLRLGEGRSWRLLETLAAELAELVLAEFGARRVTVEVKKFIIPEARHVSVEVTRSRAGGGSSPGRGVPHLQQQLGGVPGGLR